MQMKLSFSLSVWSTCEVSTNASTSSSLIPEQAGSPTPFVREKRGTTIYSEARAKAREVSVPAKEHQQKALRKKRSTGAGRSDAASRERTVAFPCPRADNPRSIGRTSDRTVLVWMHN
eukprot:COSAG02_NODE_3678_length_6391_cov_3.177845_1_plen_118_part_00